MKKKVKKKGFSMFAVFLAAVIIAGGLWAMFSTINLHRGSGNYDNDCEHHYCTDDEDCEVSALIEYYENKIKQLQYQLDNLSDYKQGIIDQLNYEIGVLQGIIEQFQNMTNNSIFAVFKFGGIIYNIQPVSPNGFATVPQLPYYIDASDFIGWTIDGVTLVNPVTTPITQNTVFNAVYWRTILDIHQDVYDYSYFFQVYGSININTVFGSMPFMLWSFNTNILSDYFNEPINNRDVKIFIGTEDYTSEKIIINPNSFTPFAIDSDNDNLEMGFAKVDGNNIIIAVLTSSLFIHPPFIIQVLSIDGFQVPA